MTKPTYEELQGHLRTMVQINKSLKQRLEFAETRLGFYRPAWGELARGEATPQEQRAKLGEF